VNTPTLHLRDTASLKLHPLQIAIPVPDKSSEAWRTFVCSVKEKGILQPLLVTEAGAIMDGGWRWRAATEAALPKVPVMVRDGKEAERIIFDSLLNRKQFSRGTAAFVLLRVKPDLVADAALRRTQNLRGQPNGNGCSSVSLSEQASLWGISERTLVDAVRVFKLFRDQPDLQAKYEPLLLAGEYSLAGIIQEATTSAKAEPASRPKPASRGKATQLRKSKRGRDLPKSGMQLFGEAFDKLSSALFQWHRFAPENRTKILSTWRHFVQVSLPPEFREALLPLEPITAPNNPDTFVTDRSLAPSTAAGADPTH